MSRLVEVDSLEVTVIVDNELDVTSWVAPERVIVKRHFLQMSIGSPYRTELDGESYKELHLGDLCCAGHGFSAMLTATKDGVKHSIMMDAGPDGDLWEQNALRLKADLASIEVVQLSHWHIDHSGGLVRAVKMIHEARKAKGINEPLIIDLHPDRPARRGANLMGTPASWEEDPTFAELEAAGAVVRKSSDSHSVLDDFFLISGFIPRKVPYEVGLKFGIAYDKALKKWVEDEAIADERFLACNVKGKGIVVLTGCSHRGVVSACHAALDQAAEGQAVRPALHAVVGGFHLFMPDSPIPETVDDLVKLDPYVLLPGHCSGWRAKFEIEKKMPGRLVACTVGGVYQF